MGNCVRKESGMQWAGEDWGTPAPSSESENRSGGEYDRKLGEKQIIHQSGGFSGRKTAPAPATEVKIKITRKQLEQLLSTTHVEGLSVQQVLAQLMNVSDRFESHRRPWRPALQSIPEVN